MRAVIFSIVAFFLCNIHFSQDTLHVPVPYTTIQGAINASSDGDVVLVQPGIYYENINFNGKGITLGSLELTTGDTSYISQTIIDGNQSGSVVLFINGEDSTAIITGFTLTNGNSLNGGGIYCNLNSSPVIRNSIISNNSAEDGGGINCHNGNCSPLLINLTIKQNNASDDGGGIWVHHPSTIYVENTRIIQNTSGHKGGGIWWNGPAVPYLKDVCINNNSASFGGGACCEAAIFQTVNPLFENVTFTENTANNGGGVYIDDTSPIFMNCIFWNNSPNEISTESSANVTVSYTDIENGWSGAGIGNIDNDPLFADPLNRDFHLTIGSPCIDTGNPDPAYNDPDGTRNDMGAYYFNQPSLEIDTIYADPQTVCPGDSSQLNVTIINVAGIPIFNWTSDPPGFSSTLQNPVVYPLVTTEYIVTVTDDNSSVTDSVMVSIYPPVEIDTVYADPQEICSGESSQLNVTVINATGDPIFNWVSNPPGFNSTLQNPVVTPTVTTTYIVTVTDNCNSVSDSTIVTVYPLPQLFTVTGGGEYCEGGLGVDVGLDDSEAGIQYELYIDGNSTGNIIAGTGSQISFGNQTVEGIYTVFGSSDNCSIQMNGYTTVSIITPYEGEEICLVTVANQNMIIWNKTPGENIKSYNIYRETTQSGIYECIASIPYSSFSTYLDLNSYPEQKAYRYRISVIDSCDNESGLSPHHKTIHLTVSAGVNGWNLIWSGYEGIDFGTYYIYRSILWGSFTLLDSIQGNLTSYTDLNSSIFLSLYKIAIVNPEGCNPMAELTGYDTAFSNIAYADPVLLIEPDKAEVELDYHSDTKTLTINNLAYNEAGTISVYDICGRSVLSQGINSHKCSFNLENVSPGLFIIHVSTNYQKISRKVFIN